MNTSKLGPYINKLMATVLDTEHDDFVKELAMTELSRLKINIDEFLVKHYQPDDVAKEQVEKQLLQEDK
tara:strand:- start:203 stop:409 length:207 start_codon:yes stop_codon:yes gene_type:complete